MKRCAFFVFFVSGFSSSMKVHLRFIIVLWFFTLPALGQVETKAFLTVEGEVEKNLKVTVDDLIKLNPTEVSARDKEGKDHIYKGVTLYDLLNTAGVTFGSKLRGKNLSKYVLLKARDGYEVIYALPELDPEFTNDVVLLAYQVDGNPLPSGEGPFRLVAPADKKPARWIREITTIKVVFSKE